MADYTNPDRKSPFKKFLIIGLLFVGLIISGMVWYNYFYVFGEGVKSGTLNYAVYKGNLFKTYEGKIIQEGFGGNKTTGNLTSYEFEFSMENEAIFKQMESNSGKYFELHYKEYHNTLPWRGNTVYIVDKINAIK
ncbi:hypothetical protein [Frigoriflavimonas asaccharolytica]|uniref:6-phosphogluconate dehydrogenase n=1 Tax=Frigoriflavimonas asaccharolytica TaxID=2735899 RepID=A0A8J8G7L8_9FLAO|nr:hypothetical protein [Frigoriflavimonas asaccharolytica]NRS91437.1 hypothetical protein [Frigoriflavimonas asaccharolytica]